MSPWKRTEEIQNQNYSKGLKSTSWKSRVVCACTADCLNCSLTKVQCYILSPHDIYSENTAALPMEDTCVICTIRLRNSFFYWTWKLVFLKIRFSVQGILARPNSIVRYLFSHVSRVHVYTRLQTLPVVYAHRHDATSFGWQFAFWRMFSAQSSDILNMAILLKILLKFMYLYERWNSLPSSLSIPNLLILLMSLSASWTSKIQVQSLRPLHVH